MSHGVGVGVGLTVPAAVSVKEVAAAGQDVILAQLADACGSKVREYVAVTGAGANSHPRPLLSRQLHVRNERSTTTCMSRNTYHALLSAHQERQTQGAVASIEGQ